MADGTSRTAALELAEAYLVGLYGENPNGLLWIGGHADGFKGRAFTEPAAAAQYAIDLDERGGKGVYHRSTTLAEIVTPTGRGAAEDSAAAYYFALDIDTAGPGHKAGNLPADWVDAEHLIEKAGFPAPTQWVTSGGGWYPQWRFPEPIDVREPEQREWVTEAFTLISAHFIDVARDLGWHLDNVRDLARVFRMPGTTNRKVSDAETHCMVSRDGGPRADLGVLASIARRAQKPAPAPVVGQGSGAAPAGSLIQDAVRAFTPAEAHRFVELAGATLAAAEPGGFNVAINEFAMACAHFPWYVGRELCAKLVIKYLGSKQGWSEPDRADRDTVDSAYRATEAGRSWVAQKVDTPQADKPGAGVPDVLPSPAQPVLVARALLAGRQDVAWWRDEFYRHASAHWEIWPEPEVRRWLYECTADAVWMKPDGKGGFERAAWAPTKSRVANLVDALGVALVQRTGQEERCMALANGVLDPGTGHLAEHTPARFNLSSLPFAYEPGAACPQWEAFLESSLPGDRQAHETLAEWFGYVLSGRTDLQKIFALVGPTRCGKGTIARVLEAMVGDAGWCAPTLAKLGGGSFGTETMIGKGLAVMGDVRWTSKHVIDAVPALLGISGEDGQEIPRKYKTDWKGKLPTRIMLMSNDAPAFTDVSGALAGRLVYVSFGTSFRGREDYGLEARLMAELPGILNWALAGLARLGVQGGRFSQSSRSIALKEEVDRDSSPVTAWADDRCQLDADAEFTLDALFRSYRDWLTGENLALSPSQARFSRDLRAAFGDKGVTVARKRDGRGGQHRWVMGLRPLPGASLPQGQAFSDAE
jgi:putative DNA primase/helicase